MYGRDGTSVNCHSFPPPSFVAVYLALIIPQEMNNVLNVSDDSRKVISDYF
jgi:hypothetical protein